MEDLTFGEQVKIILKRKNMTIKELASQIEERTGKAMSRQNLTQRLGRDNFQEQDMRLIAAILGCPFQLSIFPAESTQQNAQPADEVVMQYANKAKWKDKATSANAADEGNSPQKEYSGHPAGERDMTIGELYEIHEELDELEAAPAAAETVPSEPESYESYGTDGMGQRQPEADAAMTEEQTETTSAAEEALQSEAELGKAVLYQTETGREEGDALQPEEESRSAEPGAGEAIREDEMTQTVENVAAEEAFPSETALPEAELRERAAEDLEEGKEEPSDHTGEAGQTAAEDKREEQPYESADRAEEQPPKEQKKERFSTTRIFRRKHAADKAVEENKEKKPRPVITPDSSNFEPVIKHKDVEEDLTVGEVNPYTGHEYQSNSVRMHPKRIGYVQVYDRAQHQWTDMTEWAFLGYQERKKALLGKDYEPPIYLD